MQNRINQHSYTILANRSFAQVECNQNPNENIYSKRNRLVIRIIKVNRIVLNLLETNKTNRNQTQSTILNQTNRIDSKQAKHNKKQINDLY